VLELGSGGGNVAWFLKKDFTLTLTDISGGMLAESKKQNPELEHIKGDMRTLRLGRTFDGVLIHDAIMYMTSEEDLRAALVTAHVHCKTSGVVVIAPDWVSETFSPHTTHEGVDVGERGVRYLEEDEELRTVVDRQIVGVFPHATWLRLLEDVGFKVEVVEDPSTGGERSEVFVGHKQ
jgi:ubiquinone/menaquinone biosynthesis C-methylase UbiE